MTICVFCRLCKVMDILAQRFDCVKGDVGLWNCGIWITKGTKAREKHESAFVFEQVVKAAPHGRVAALGGRVIWCGAWDTILNLVVQNSG